MNNCKTICLTVLLCWAMLMGVLAYAVSGHTGTAVERWTRVEVHGK